MYTIVCRIIAHRMAVCKDNGEDSVPIRLQRLVVIAYGCFCHPQEIFDEAIYMFSNNILCLSTEVRGMHMSWQALHRQAHQSILSVLNCYQSPICLYLPSRDCQISERTMLSEATIPYAAIPWLKLTSALYHHVILYSISFSFDTMWHNNNMYRDFRFNTSTIFDARHQWWEARVKMFECWKNIDNIKSLWSKM